MTSLRILNLPQDYRDSDVHALFVGLGTIVAMVRESDQPGIRPGSVLVDLAEDGVAAIAVATLHGSEHGGHYLLVRNASRSARATLAAAPPDGTRQSLTSSPS